MLAQLVVQLQLKHLELDRELAAPDPVLEELKGRLADRQRVTRC